MTKQNADNAQQANTLASEARKAADNGTESMGRMNTAIQDIQKSSDEKATVKSASARTIPLDDDNTTYSMDDFNN